MRAGDDLHDGGHAIALDPRDDAREPVPRRLGDDRPIHARAPPLVQESRHLVHRA